MLKKLWVAMSKFVTVALLIVACFALIPTRSLAVVDTTPPTVSMTSPADGAIVSGSSVSITATASDNVGVAGVQFKLNGNNIGSEDATAPYSIIWNSTSVIDDSYAITATARDAAGLTTTSAAVDVVVSNAANTVPPVISLVVPVGTLPVGTTNTDLIVSTDANATCKFGVIPNVAFASQANTFTTTGGTTHTYGLTGLADGTDYNYYVRCSNAANDTNLTDFVVAFNVASQKSSSNSSSSHKKKKKTSASRKIYDSSKTVTRGQILTQSGKKFSKNSTVAVYFSRPNGTYYPPQIIRTTSTGSFSISYRVMKPAGTYKWYAKDSKSGKKSKVISYKVR